MKVETTKLRTINNYAMENKVTRAYIYKLLTEQKMQAIEIDGVKFIDTSKFPSLKKK